MKIFFDCGVFLNLTQDEWSRSSVDNIYAVGDVTDRINLTPVALAGQRILIHNIVDTDLCASRGPCCC